MDSAYAWLAWGHPTFATLVLLGLAYVAKLGLTQRRARISKQPAPRGNRHRHVRWAPVVLALVAVAFVGGAFSSSVFRGWPMFRTPHGWLAATALAAFTAVFFMGRRATVSHATAPRHGAIALATLAFTLAVVVTGLLLLPL